jgi:rare lipoprotein A
MKRVVAIAVLTLLAVACATTTQAPAPLPPQNERGIASWYGQEFAGRTTANGEIFDPLLMTAAHRSLPFGTLVDVKNLKTGQSVRVRINDRGPYISNRLIDLSYAAAQQIGLVDPGSGEVELSIVKVGRGDREPPVPYSVAAAEAPPAISASPAPAPAPVPQPAPPPPVPVTVDNVQVVQEHAGMETRRQVSASGTSIETVPVKPAEPPAAKPAPAPVPAPVPPPRPRIASTAGKYFVQAGAFSIEANAKALQRQLEKIGEPATIEHTTLFRVRIGPFATRDEALRERTHLESAGMSAIVVMD